MIVTDINVAIIGAGPYGFEMLRLGIPEKAIKGFSVRKGDS